MSEGRQSAISAPYHGLGSSPSLTHYLWLPGSVRSSPSRQHTLLAPPESAICVESKQEGACYLGIREGLGAQGDPWVLQHSLQERKGGIRRQ